MKKRSIFLWFLFGLIIGIESQSTPVIQTTTGPIQGEVLKTVVQSLEYSAFKGIPYAEPPLDYLRFKPPVPKKPWNDVLKTTTEGSNCIQKDFVYHNIYTGSEDCLFLNVYTPKLQFDDTSDLIPIFVWIHGGSFKSGYGNSSLYGPDFLIEEGLIVVTLNYRLGPLGFLNLNHENATGNAGLKDQNLALRWIKNNIKKFGGNPNSITLAGQSAGGAAVDFHVLSDMSRGLFHRAISMSASPLNPWAFSTPESAQSKAFTLSEKLGKKTKSKDEVLENLYATPAIEIVQQAEKMGIADPPFKPSIENSDLAKNEEKFLTQCSYWKYVSGNFDKIPYLTGFVSHEANLFASSAESLLEMIRFLTSVISTFPASLPISLPKTSAVVSAIANHTQNFADKAIMAIINEASNVLFVAGIDLKQKLIRTHSNNPVYYYRFSYETEQALHKLLYNISLNGTAHGDDIAYLFHIPIVNLSLDSNDLMYITRRRMVRLWSNFAKYSNPTPDGENDLLLQGITWPPSGTLNNYLIFNKNLEIGQKPISANTELIEKAYLAVLPVQTGCIGDILKKVTNINPFSNVSTGNPIESFAQSIGQTIFNIGKPIVSTISEIFG